MTTAYVLLGSNHDPARNLRLAAARLSPLAASPVYRTAPVRGATAPFLNAALRLDTDLDPDTLEHTLLKPLEDALGRQRHPHAPVTIDLDLAWHPQRDPHPDLTRYAHAAVPLADLAPDLLIHGTPLRTLATRLRTTADLHPCDWTL